MAVLVYGWASAWGTSMMTGFQAPHISINSLDKDIDDMLTLGTDVTSLVDNDIMSDEGLKIQKDPRYCQVKKPSFRAVCSICFCLCKKQVKYKNQSWYWLVAA